jgi:hypothetical protein
MKTIKTFSNRHLAGEYKETKIDKAKKKSNILTSICGKYRTVKLVTGETIEIVGKRAWDNWAKENEYMTDF